MFLYEFNWFLLCEKTCRDAFNFKYIVFILFCYINFKKHICSQIYEWWCTLEVCINFSYINEIYQVKKSFNIRDLTD